MSANGFADTVGGFFVFS